MEDRNENQFAVATLGGSQEAIVRICAWGLDLNRGGVYVYVILVKRY